MNCLRPVRTRAIRIVPPNGFSYNIIGYGLGGAAPGYVAWPPYRIPIGRHDHALWHKFQTASCRCTLVSVLKNIFFCQKFFGCLGLNVFDFGGFLVNYVRFGLILLVFSFLLTYMSYKIFFYCLLIFIGYFKNRVC